jgi:hypothetical protein
MKIILWVTLSLLTTSVYCQESERTHEQKRRIIFSDIIRDSNGDILLLNQRAASQYCKRIQSRLPTARELTLLSKNFGAKGILERCENTSSEAMTQDDLKCSQVQALNANGEYEDFFYDYSGFKFKSLGRLYTWSSSVHPYFPNHGYTLSGVAGILDLHPINLITQFRCVKNQ